MHRRHAALNAQIGEKLPVSAILDHLRRLGCLIEDVMHRRQILIESGHHVLPTPQVSQRIRAVSWERRGERTRPDQPQPRQQKHKDTCPEESGRAAQGA